MTTLNCEHVTPAWLVSFELGKPCGAVLPETKHGAAATTPNGRLVSEDIIGRRTQSLSQPRGEGRRSSPTHGHMRISRSPPARRFSRATGGRDTDALPRSRLTARLHGQPRPNLRSAPNPGDSRLPRPAAARPRSGHCAPIIGMGRDAAAEGVVDGVGPRLAEPSSACYRERADMPAEPEAVATAPALVTRRSEVREGEP